MMHGFSIASCMSSACPNPMAAQDSAPLACTPTSSLSSAPRQGTHDFTSPASLYYELRT